MLWLTLRKLKSHNFRKRLSAVRKLATYRSDKAIVPLVHAIGDPDPIGKGATESLAQLQVQSGKIYLLLTKRLAEAKRNQESDWLHRAKISLGTFAHERMFLGRIRGRPDEVGPIVEFLFSLLEDESCDSEELVGRIIDSVAKEDWIAIGGYVIGATSKGGRHVTREAIKILGHLRAPETLAKIVDGEPCSGARETKISADLRELALETLLTSSYGSDRDIWEPVWMRALAKESLCQTAAKFLAHQIERLPELRALQNDSQFSEETLQGRTLRGAIMKLSEEKNNEWPSLIKKAMMGKVDCIRRLGALRDSRAISVLKDIFLMDYYGDAFRKRECREAVMGAMARISQVEFFELYHISIQEDFRYGCPLHSSCREKLTYLGNGKWECAVHKDVYTYLDRTSRDKYEEVGLVLEERRSSAEVVENLKYWSVASCIQCKEKATYWEIKSTVNRGTCRKCGYVHHGHF